MERPVLIVRFIASVLDPVQNILKRSYNALLQIREPTIGITALVWANQKIVELWLLAYFAVLKRLIEQFKGTCRENLNST